MASYKNPVIIKVEAPASFTKAALNKCLIITDEHKTGAITKDAPVIKTFMSSKEVGEYFGNNSKTFKTVEFFLGQKQYPAKQPLVPDYFVVLSVKGIGATKEDVVEALNELALGYEWYALTHCLEAGTLEQGDLNSWLNENRKIMFENTASNTIAESLKSDRYVLIHNKVEEEDKAAAFMATVITPGAGSKANRNILSMCSADVSGGEMNELSMANINFTRKATSKGYVIVENGVATDDSKISETTALDCIIYNLLDNIEILLAESGIEEDDRGYAKLQGRLTEVMEEMGGMGLLAVEGKNYAYKVPNITQSAADRQLHEIEVAIPMRLKTWADYITIVLQRTYDNVTGGNE